MKFAHIALMLGLLHCASHNPPKATSAAGGLASASSGVGPSTRSRAIKVVDYQTSQPVPGRHAISNDINGALVAEGDTDPDGIVTLAEPPGGSISLLWSLTSTSQGQLTIDRQIDTLVDPPDTVVTVPIFVAAVTSQPPNEPMNQLNVSVSSAPPATASVLLSVSCGSTSTLSPYSPGAAQSYSQYKGCPGSHSFAVVAIAFNSANDIVATGSVSNLLLQPGATISIAIPLSPASGNAFDATVSNVPPEATRAGISLHGARDDGTEFVAYADQLTLPIGPTLTMHVGTPTNFSTRWDVLFGVERGSLAGAERRLPLDHFPAAASFDLNDLANLVTPSRDLSDLVHPSISWALGPGPTGTGIKVIQPWALLGPVNVTWTALTSSAETQVRLPTLPVAYQNWLLVPGAGVRDTYLRHSQVPGSDFGAWMSAALRTIPVGEDARYATIPSN